MDKQNCCHTRCLSGNQTIRPAICSRTWARIGDSLLSETQLADNLLLLVLKFNESAKLSEQFQLEYQEMMHIRQHNYQAIFERLRKFILDPKFAIVTDEPKYILNMASPRTTSCASGTTSNDPSFLLLSRRTSMESFSCNRK